MPTLPFEQPLKFIAHGRILESLLYHYVPMHVQTNLHL